MAEVETGLLPRRLGQWSNSPDSSSFHTHVTVSPCNAGCAATAQDMEQYLNTPMALSGKARRAGDNCYTRSYDYCYYDNASSMSSPCCCYSARLWRYCLAICSVGKRIICGASGCPKEITVKKHQIGWLSNSV